MNTMSETAQAFAAAESLRDPETRRQVRADPKGYALENGIIPAGMAQNMEVKVVESGRDVLYVPLVAPSDIDTLEAADLASIQGGGPRASTTGSASSLGCMFCICTSASTAGSAASVSTVAIEPGRE